MNKIKQYRWLIATVAVLFSIGIWAGAEYNFWESITDKIAMLAYEDIKVDIPEFAEVAPSFGAMVGPDSPYTYMGVGGRREVWLAYNYTQASSTLCSFSPEFGTTTLMALGFQTTTGTTTATTIHVAKATITTSDATTTNIHSYTVAATDLGTFLVMATSTNNLHGNILDEDDTTWHVTSDEIVNISVQGADGPLGDGDHTGNAMQGTCWAKFYVY